jgi:osmoprotectant transport system permease protein
MPVLLASRLRGAVRLRQHAGAGQHRGPVLNASTLARRLGARPADALSTVLVILIAVPLGIVLTRPFAARVRAYLVAVLNLARPSRPSASWFCWRSPSCSSASAPPSSGLVLYAIVPVLLNTMVGLGAGGPVRPRGGPRDGHVELGRAAQDRAALAVPVVAAGVRTALVINVGSATLVTYINAGGLGDVIAAGLSTNRLSIQLVGAGLTAVLALLIDYLAGHRRGPAATRGL